MSTKQSWLTYCHSGLYKMWNNTVADTEVGRVETAHSTSSTQLCQSFLKRWLDISRNSMLISLLLTAVQCVSAFKVTNMITCYSKVIWQPKISVACQYMWWQLSTVTNSQRSYREGNVHWLHYGRGVPPVQGKANVHTGNPKTFVMAAALVESFEKLQALHTYPSWKGITAV